MEESQTSTTLGEKRKPDANNNQEMSKTRIVAVDGEWRGNNALTHGILSLGWVIGKADTFEVLEKKRINFDRMYTILQKKVNVVNFDSNGLVAHPRIEQQKYEPRCLEEFWSKHTDKKDALEKDPVNPMEAIARFRASIDNLERNGFKVVLVTDAPGRDFHYINTYLDHAGLPDINTSLDGSYRQTYSTEDYARGALAMDFDDLHLKNVEMEDAFDVPIDNDITHDHMPENDAEYIYKLYFFTVKRTVTNKKSRKE